MAELKTRTRGPEFLAKRNGPCTGCDRPIVKDEDYICKVDGVKGVFHGLCAAGYCRVLEQHSEEGDE